MKIKYMLLLPLALLFLAKYMQIFVTSSGSTPIEVQSAVSLGATVAIAISAVLMLALSFLHLEGRWRWGNVALSAAALLFISLLFVMPSVWFYMMYNLLLAIALLILLYPFHHYEIKKYPAFGAAFLFIYDLT